MFSKTEGNPRRCNVYIFPIVINVLDDVSVCTINAKSSMCSETQSIYGITTTCCSLVYIYKFSAKLFVAT